MELIKNIDKWEVCVADLRNQIESCPEFQVLLNTLGLLKEYQYWATNLLDDAAEVKAEQNKVKRQLYNMLTKLEKQIGLPFAP